ncbi:bifunctional enzyme IspD/IspF [Agromyces luteolus]|uniref:Bifunctional enzyme IspD/IspF n=1 Tax=Agromyces luteolus TaxID=88373 RepID=A0A7C9LZ01_9MICO|nr:2-C-methyl-D-erythritol 4-phosphate cytidylyltransferase [Agromyces luteolus]MUN07173.1 2-C-methyl-D-erythritol 2,4-cyclodiphosphate synthase [Agromyces luteolus]GLK29395.1 bifunctional enzyme IspD/IspF [Agromyces luteolus]
MNDSTVAVIVVAAGSGTRLGHPEPKALVPLGEDTILGVALDAVLGMRDAPFVVVVAPADRVDEVRERSAPRAAAASVDLVVVAGGLTRQESVARGIAELPREIEVVLVHDAARPLAPSAVFDEVAAAVESRGHGIVPGLPVVDTVKRVDGEGHVLETVDRSELAAMQTPQGFPREVLESAYAAAGADFTDDAALVAAAGVPVDVVPGDARAFKVTVPSDLHRAEQLLAERTANGAAGERSTQRALPAHAAVPRVGTGIDVHAFADAQDTPLWLAGLHWPGERGLSGHSDGDAVAHAICDALLAAAGLGDIGGMFGTDDPRFSGAHGEVFVGETVRRLAAAGWRVGNVSVQVVGNRPKLAPRRAEAEALLTGIVGAPVSVAATTTDGLGFTGRGEGVTAIATALVLPA